MKPKFKRKSWVFGDNLDAGNKIIPFGKVNSGEINVTNMWCSIVNMVQYV